MYLRLLGLGGSGAIGVFGTFIRGGWPGGLTGGCCGVLPADFVLTWFMGGGGVGPAVSVFVGPAGFHGPQSLPWFGLPVCWLFCCGF